MKCESRVNTGNTRVVLVLVLGIIRYGTAVYTQQTTVCNCVIYLVHMCGTATYITARVMCNGTTTINLWDTHDTYVHNMYVKCVRTKISPSFSWNNNPFATSRNQLQQFVVLMVPLGKILDNPFDSVTVFKRRTFVGTKQVLPHRAVQYQTWQMDLLKPFVHSVVRQWILWTRVLFVL